MLQLRTAALAAAAVCIAVATVLLWRRRHRACHRCRRNYVIPIPLFSILIIA